MQQTADENKKAQETGFRIQVTGFRTLGKANRIIIKWDIIQIYSTIEKKLDGMGEGALCCSRE